MRTCRGKRPGLRHSLAIAGMIAALGLGLFLRTVHLGRLEAFVDEGGNILTSIDPGTRLAVAPLEQGRPLLAYDFKSAALMPNSPVLAARLTTVAASAVTIAAVGATLFFLAGEAAALAGMWLWAVLPFAVFHDRLALQDPFVTAALAVALASIALGSRGGKASTGDFASFLVAGLMLGLAFLTKISAVEAFPWLALVYFSIQVHAGRRLFDPRLIALCFGAALPLLCLGRDLPRLGSGLATLASTLPSEGHASWTATILALFAALPEHMETFAAWYWGYDGWPGLILWTAGAAGLALRPSRELGALALAWPAAFLSDAVAYNHPYARYAHPSHLPLVLFAAAGLQNWFGAAAATRRSRLAVAAIGPGIAMLALFSRSFRISQDIKNAPIPSSEIEQYGTGDWSGNGIAKIDRYLHDYAKRHKSPCVVLAADYWRTSFYDLKLESWNDPSIRVRPVDVRRPDDLASILSAVNRAGPGPRPAVFLLFERNLYPAPKWMGPSLVLDVPRLSGSNDFQLFSCRIDRLTGAAFDVQTAPYPDRWIGPHFATTLSSDRSTSRLVLTGDTDERFRAVDPVLKIFVDGRFLAQASLGRLPDPFRLAEPVALTSGRHRVELVGIKWFVPSDFGPSVDHRILFIRLGVLSLR